MKRIIGLLVLLVNILFGESRYICLIKQNYNAYSLKIYSGVGLESVDKMILTLNKNILTHNFKTYEKKDRKINYSKISSGTTTMYDPKIKKVSYTAYEQNNSSTPIIIYSFDNFDKIIRVNMESINTYSCTKF